VGSQSSSEGSGSLISQVSGDVLGLLQVLSDSGSVLLVDDGQVFSDGLSVNLNLGDLGSSGTTSDLKGSEVSQFLLVLIEALKEFLISVGSDLENSKLLVSHCVLKKKWRRYICIWYFFGFVR